MQHTTNYQNTFIEVADDCPVRVATEPPLNPSKISGARFSFELLQNLPYTYTSDDLLFMLHVQKQSSPLEDESEQRNTFFSKGKPCMRASDLTKKYGWGIHFNGQAKMALVPLGSTQYEAYRTDPNLAHKKAMRSSKV